MFTVVAMRGYIALADFLLDKSLFGIVLLGGRLARFGFDYHFAPFAFAFRYRRYLKIIGQEAVYIAPHLRRHRAEAVYAFCAFYH